MRPLLLSRLIHSRGEKSLLVLCTLGLVFYFSSRNPFISEEDQGEEEKQHVIEEKGKKNKNKGQSKKLDKNKPMLVDVDLGLSAYANAKK